MRLECESLDQGGKGVLAPADESCTQRQLAVPLDRRDHVGGQRAGALAATRLLLRLAQTGQRDLPVPAPRGDRMAHQGVRCAARRSDARTS